MTLTGGVLVKGFSRQQDVVLADAMDLVIRNASRQELLQFFVSKFMEHSTCDAVFVVEALQPDQSRHRPDWTLSGLCCAGIQDVRWTNFCLYLSGITSQDHWIPSQVKERSDGVLLSRLWLSDDGANKKIFEDIKRVVDVHTSQWISILRLPSPSATYPTRFVIVAYGTTPGQVPHGGEQDWRLLELFRRIYQLALVDLQRKTKDIVDHRKELMRDLAPSIIHHEINNRVANSVRTLEQLSKKISQIEGPEKDDLRDLCDALSLDIEMLDRITHAVMGLERQTGNEEIRLIDELHLLRDLTTFRLSKIGGELPIQCPENLQITTSSALLLHIFVNLVNNAVDALTPVKELDSSFKPRITIDVQIVDQDSENSSEDSKDIEVLVSDNGHGVTDDQLSRLFDVGYTTKRSGHGFGLPISRLLAGFLGGTLDYVSNSSGTGSCFRLGLPLVAPATDAIERELEKLLNAK